MLLLIFYNKVVKLAMLHYTNPVQPGQADQCNCPQCPAWPGSFSLLKCSNFHKIL